MFRRCFFIASVGHRRACTKFAQRFRCGGAKVLYSHRNLLATLLVFLSFSGRCTIPINKYSPSSHAKDISIMNNDQRRHFYSRLMMAATIDTRCKMASSHTPFLYTPTTDPT